MSRFKDQKPFYRIREADPEANQSSRVVTMRLNPKEEAQIKKLRDILDIEADTKAVKIAMQIGLNVLQHTFGEDLARYLFSQKRERKSDYEKPQKTENPDSVIPKNPEM